jgi:hypothetical protein
MTEERYDFNYPLNEEHSWVETWVASGTPDIQVRRYVNEPGICLD